MLLFTWLAVSKPRQIALATVAGIQSAMLIWALCGLLGLAWFIESFPQAFRGVQIVGGLYLIWRGFVLARFAWTGGVGRCAHSARPANSRPPAPIAPGSSPTCPNPKTLAFVASLFATTSVIHAPLWIGLLGVALMITMSGSYYLICLWLLTRPGALAAYARAERTITAGAGVIFMIFGLQLLSAGLVV
jgi:threonine/homoserine/homoserine lactone efflux protein